MTEKEIRLCQLEDNLKEAKATGDKKWFDELAFEIAELKESMK